MTGREFRHRLEAAVPGARVTKQPWGRNFYVEVVDGDGLVCAKLAFSMEQVQRCDDPAAFEAIYEAVRHSMALSNHDRC